MSRVLTLALSAALALGAAAPVANAEDGVAFMERFSGKWVGSGQLLVGGSIEFACELKGNPNAGPSTFGMTGICRMGAMGASIHAQIRYNAETDSYYGAFLGGAEGDGVDLVGTRAGEGFSLKLVRGSTQGRLTAETSSPDQMKVVIYYRDVRRDRELPVVAMALSRTESAASRAGSNLAGRSTYPMD
ncbi:MAG TPA: hypothetical protein VGA77_03940 [Propylenella sp.]